MKPSSRAPYSGSNRLFWRLCALALGVSVLTACGGSDGISISGVAATGAALSNTNYAVKCVSGTATGTTGQDGSYAVAVANGSFPCLIEATGSKGKLHSIAQSSNTSAIANITPLTEQLVGQLSPDTIAFFENFAASDASRLSADKIKAAQDAVFAALAASGIAVPASVTSLLEGSLRPAVGTQAGNDYDKLLDKVAVTPVSVKLIALNDFHGNIEPTSETNGGSVVLPDGGAGKRVAVGGAAYLATVVKNLKAKNPNNIMVGAGDLVGASPFASSITHDEASIDILNQIGLEVTSIGNHEFDRGATELKRLQNGGCYPASGNQGIVGKDTCLIDGSFPGAKFKYLTANVVDSSSGKPLFAATKGGRPWRQRSMTRAAQA